MQHLDELLTTFRLQQQPLEAHMISSSFTTSQLLVVHRASCMANAGRLTRHGASHVAKIPADARHDAGPEAYQAEL
jgi:hypothetical protein